MKQIARSIFVSIILLLCWQGFIFLAQIPDYILPSPWQVCLTLYQQKNLLMTHSIPTIGEMLLGFVLGICVGSIVGFILAYSRSLAAWFLPLLIISQAIPTFAIAPLLVIWLGYGLTSKIVTSILMIFFPVASAFYDGLQSTPTGWLDLAYTMNANKWRIFWTIQIPAALPSLGSGIRIAAVLAPMGAIVGEWVGSSQGLGYLMINANARMQIDMMFAALIVIILLALTLYFSVNKLLRIGLWWC